MYYLKNHNIWNSILHFYKKENGVWTKINEKQFYQSAYSGILSTIREYVDLGLPSGTLWATENVKDEYGNELYFAWGETRGYTSGQVGTDKYFNWNYYELSSDDGETMSKYNEDDGKTTLEPNDDAAYVNLGPIWKIPTIEQFNELIDNTTVSFTQYERINGLLFTSTVNGFTDKSLFFPAVGGAVNGDISGFNANGYYWSSSLLNINVSASWIINFTNENCGMSNSNRYFGYSIRPICKNN